MKRIVADVVVVVVVQAKAHQMPFYSITIETFFGMNQRGRQRKTKNDEQPREIKKQKHTHTHIMATNSKEDHMNDDRYFTCELYSKQQTKSPCNI